MPIYKFQWKDPDFYDGVDILDEDRDKLRKAGIGEYLQVSYDSDTDQAVVIRPRKR